MNGWNLFMCIHVCTVIYVHLPHDRFHDYRVDGVWHNKMKALIGGLSQRISDMKCTVIIGSGGHELEPRSGRIWGA